VGVTPLRKPVDRAHVDAELQRVVELRHPDPHSVLGIHPDGDGLVIRTFRPDAESITAIPDSGGQIALAHRHGGVFEGRVPGKTELFGYLLEVKYPHGASFTLRDPYSFLPTVGDMDVYFAAEGRHEKLWSKLGAHLAHHHGVAGVSFAVWAPTAAGVSVVGDFNSWDGRLHAMRKLGSSGLWELFIPEVGVGTRYKFEIRPASGGPPLLKTDPFAFRTEAPPLTASVVHDLSQYTWGDQAWLSRRLEGDVAQKPFSIYELHVGSWRRVVEEGNRPLTYRELAPILADYLLDLGFTHVELMPVAEHPYGPSWGYQVVSYYAPTARYGHPDDFRFFVDHLHQRGLGVILDWVPGHFPKDAHGLGRFDGTACYEHADPRQGEQPDWGTFVFNFGRNEVRNFLVANALYWIEEYHLDGLRVDAVASMLYLDYSRKAGEWVPNKHGGRENEEAIKFLQELNSVVRIKHHGVAMIAEESTAWPRVTQRTEDGGLGFHFKWNMGWMHDTLKYFSKDPIYRRYHHNNLTFGLLYAFSEQFVLPFSHDEVVYGKGSMLGKQPGDPWQKLANLRALYAWMWAHPGKKLLFMGSELAQPSEWAHDRSLDWHLLHDPAHRGVQSLLRDLNHRYQRDSSLFENDAEPKGFQWIQADSADDNIYAFVRWSASGQHHLVCVANLAPVPRTYRIGVPRAAAYHEVLNTDAWQYGGSGIGNLGQVNAHGLPWNGMPASVELRLPPLGVVWLAPEA
jgi:1,4-alpha-glucan branching enzyme